MEAEIINCRIYWKWVLLQNKDKFCQKCILTVNRKALKELLYLYSYKMPPSPDTSESLIENLSLLILFSQSAKSKFLLLIFLNPEKAS